MTQDGFVRPGAFSKRRPGRPPAYRIEFPPDWPVVDLRRLNSDDELVARAQTLVDLDAMPEEQRSAVLGTLLSSSREGVDFLAVTCLEVIDGRPAVASLSLGWQAGAVAPAERGFASAAATSRVGTGVGEAELVREAVDVRFRGPVVTEAVLHMVQIRAPLPDGTWTALVSGTVLGDEHARLLEQVVRRTAETFQI